MPVDWPWGILIKQYFWMCVTTFWVRLAIESIDSGKQISFPNIGGYFEELNRAKGRKSRNSPFWSDSLLELEHLIFSYSGLRLNYTWTIHFLDRISHPLKSCEPIPHNNDVYISVEFSSVQSLSRVQLFATPWTAAHQASLSITNSWSPFKPMSIVSVMPSNHLILCCPLLLLPSIFLSIRVFSNEYVYIYISIWKQKSSIGCFCVENCNISIFQICPCSDQL